MLVFGAQYPSVLWTAGIHLVSHVQGYMLYVHAAGYLHAYHSLHVSVTRCVCVFVAVCLGPCLPLAPHPHKKKGGLETNAQNQDSGALVFSALLLTVTAVSPAHGYLVLPTTISRSSFILGVKQLLHVGSLELLQHEKGTSIIASIILCQ